MVAAPGTGKTRTLTCRIAHLIQTQTARADQILAVTFTNKAAAEMKERISAFLGKTADPPLAATFHAFCNRFLREARNSNDFSIIDDYERLQLVRKAIAIVKQAGTNIKGRADQVCEQIIRAKQRILSPKDDLSSVARGLDPDQLAKVYLAYQELMETQKIWDYEDLIFQTVAILEADSSIREQFQRRFPYIFVDEYQDLNYGQYRIIQALTRPDGNICVIGDPDQSIYGFRGSDVKFFNQFMTDFPAATCIRLTRNYRSTETILEASHQAIRGHSLNDARERIRSGIEGPKTIRFLNAHSENAEAVVIGKTIEQMVGGTGFYFDDFGGNESARQGSYHAFSDFAVLFRTRAQGDIIAEVFDKAGIPFQIATKENLFRHKGVQELISCLKLLEGAGTYADFDIAAQTIVPDIETSDIKMLKNWGYANGLTLNGLLAEAERTRIEEISQSGRLQLDRFYAALATYSIEISGLTVAQKLHYLEEKPEFRAICRAEAHTREAFGRVIGMADYFDDNTAAFIESVALQTDPDSFDTASQKVALLTLHAAKGLEFPVVFIAGFEDGYIPLRHGSGTVSDPAEERRLFYVAMTRAETMLFLTRAATRRIYGKKEHRRPSPFLSDIEPRLLAEETREIKAKPTGQQQLNLF